MIFTDPLITHASPDRAARRPEPVTASVRQHCHLEEKQQQQQQEPPPPLYKLPVKADGRCMVRSVLGGASRQTDDTAFIREVRIAAMRALRDRMESDEELSNLVHWSFPDEMYESFEDWSAAQHTDDTDDAVSDLWRGGGQWMLYGLGLHLRLRIFVHNVDSSSRSLLDATASGTELVDARPAEVRAAAERQGENALSPSERASTVHLASMRADDGTAHHFDVLLLDGPQPGAEPVSRHRPTATSAAAAAPSGSFTLNLLPRGSKPVSLLMWALLNVLLLSLVMGGWHARIATQEVLFGPSEAAGYRAWQPPRAAARDRLVRLVMGENARRSGGQLLATGEVELVREGGMRLATLHEQSVVEGLPPLLPRLSAWAEHGVVAGMDGD
jgi:hypothetical protein